MSDPSAPPRRPPDYERDLGVIEAFMIILDQCPSGSVRAVAEAALAASKGGSAGRKPGDPGVLREQAWLVLMAIKGWRGDRAAQVHRSLSKFLDPAAANPGPSSRR